MLEHGQAKSRLLTLKRGLVLQQLTFLGFIVDHVPCMRTLVCINALGLLEVQSLTVMLDCQMLNAVASC